MSDLADIGGTELGFANLNSSNFGPTAVANQNMTGAQTQGVQAQAQAQQMQNKIMQARMPLILNGIAQLNDESAGSADRSGTGLVGSASGNSAAAGPATPGAQVASEDKSAVPPAQNFYQPALIDAALRAKYFVQPYTPQEQQALQKAYLVDPQDQYGMGPKRVMAMHDMRIQQQTQNNQMDARDDFDKMSAVTDAPDGQAMSILEASHPETTAAIRKQLAKDPNEAADEDGAARLFARHVAGEVHQYTGREAVEGPDGVYRDAATKIPIPGVDKVGLSTAQYIKLAQDAITPSVDVPDGSGGSMKVAPWRAAQLGGAKNINSPADWIAISASHMGLPGAASTLSPNSAQKQESRAVITSALAQVQKQAAAAPPATNGSTNPVNGVGTARNAQGNIDQPLTDALHDTDYHYQPSNNGVPYTPTIGHSPPPAVLDDMQKQTAARNNLAKTANDGVGAAAAALTMYKAAQDVLAKGNYNGGAWNQELAKYSKWLPAGWQDHMTGDYQEIAKYLGNAALQSGKGIFSKMTEKESDTVMHDLNPSPGMDPTALSDMISRGAKMAQYSLDSTKRVPAYLHAGLDANQFGSWNQTHFPMETETKVTPSTPNAGVAPVPKYNDAQVSAYMKKYGLTDLQDTRKKLGLQ
jgi:hypothetical protein